jgi:hypothetical protein
VPMDDCLAGVEHGVDGALRLSDWWESIVTCLGLIAGVIPGLAVWSWRCDARDHRRTCIGSHPCSPTAQGVRRVIPWLGILALLLTASPAWTASVGDQVTLEARIRAGVPLHQEPRGTHDFQRIPDGTKATVIELAQDGRWLKLSLLDGRTGWVTSSYISERVPGPSTGTSPIGKTPLRTEEGLVERVADGDTITVITPNQTKLRIRLWGIDAPETPTGTKCNGALTADRWTHASRRVCKGLCTIYTATSIPTSMQRCTRPPPRA